MAITEIWFAECSAVNISGYNFYRRDKSSHAGGISIYLRSDLDSCEISDGVLTDSAVEQVWCAIKIFNEKILRLYKYPGLKLREYSHVQFPY